MESCASIQSAGSATRVPSAFVVSVRQRSDRTT